MTRGRPREGHPADLALKNDNSIVKLACRLPSNIFGGLGFPVQVEARVKVLSLSMCFAYAKHRFLTRQDEETDAQNLKTPRKNYDSRRPCINHTFIFKASLQKQLLQIPPRWAGYFGSPAEDCQHHVLLSPKCAN